jgi:2,3-bisphosphoglycerate-independent phosphoglycerate mutase
MVTAASPRDATGPLVLMVLDGWGMREDAADNAITRAPARAFYELWETYPHTLLEAHGEAVGLVEGQMGDSNVGHLNLGAGRVVYQNLARIFRAAADGTLARSPVLAEAFARGRSHALHLFGLLSDGGVHSHMDHLLALLELARAADVRRAYLHLCLDGRDVPPQSAFRYLERLAEGLARIGVGAVATVMGRYYGMDRDNRWERTEKAYRAMVEGAGPTARSAPEAVARSYADGITDEFVMPTVLVDAAGRPVATIRPDDAVFVFNFRADRVRQITRALADPAFDRFPRPAGPVAWVGGMTLYDENFPLPHVFEPLSVPNNLAEWLAKLGIPQLHVAETEKYAHVTFFFNGGVEEAHPGEDRILIPSPKVATYDLKPEMSAPAITEAVLAALAPDAPKRYGFILLNYANSDMVGHTGIQEAAEAGVRAVDAGIRAIHEAVRARGGWLVVTADHGNAERMRDDAGQPDTNHTKAPVPLIVAGPRRDFRLRPGKLGDVAPTILRLLGWPVPPEMTGTVLIEEGPQDGSDGPVERSGERGQEEGRDAG